MIVNRNHIKSEGILSLESSNVSISATDTWHSFITVNRRTILYSHNTSSSSETAGSPVQRILLPFECKSFSLPFRRCVQVTSPNYVTMDKKFNCTRPGIFFFFPLSLLLQPTSPSPHLIVPIYSFWAHSRFFKIERCMQIVLHSYTEMMK